MTTNPPPQTLWKKILFGFLRGCLLAVLLILAVNFGLGLALYVLENRR